MQAVILAGGLGTRLRPMTETIPKAMVPINGKPFLEYEIDLLRASGIDSIVLCVGYLGNKIRDYFGHGEDFGVDISYSLDGPNLLGPAGALKRAEPFVFDTFFVTYGDAYLRAPYRSMMKRLVDSGKLALMGAYRNDNKHGKSDLSVAGGRVVRYDKSGRGLSWINFGVSAFRKEALSLIPPGRTFGEEEFYGALIHRKELLSYPIRKRFYEIGNPESLEEFKRFISTSGAGAR